MSATGGIVVLSSSPPRVFAHSPTPADNTSSSPVFPSPGAIFAQQKLKGVQSEAGSFNGEGHFKRMRIARDGFVSDLCESSARVLLQENRGKANIPLRKSSSISHVGAQPIPDRKGDQFLAPNPNHSQELSPSRHDKATSRRLDWTPPASSSCHSSPSRAVASFSKTLFSTFGYESSSHRPGLTAGENHINEGEPTKKRKIDFSDTGISVRATATAGSKPAPQSKPSQKESISKGKKSSKNKYVTITGLATAHSRSEQTNEASPMLQYLSATQQRAAENELDSKPGTAKRKRVGKTSKTTQARSKIAPLSPHRALKAIEDQDALFGSASQLARDESPTLIRDTMLALKKSEDTAPLTSDPVSTQITIPTSEPAETPRRDNRSGVSRFLKTRKLWSAAGRDEDNALLQVDTVDLFDSPDVRTALAGKDVLVEPGAPKYISPSNAENLAPPGQDLASAWFDTVPPSPGPRGGSEKSSRAHIPEGLMDIDELELKTPCAAKNPRAIQQVRALHSAAAEKPSAIDETSNHRRPEPGQPPPPLQPRQRSVGPNLTRPSCKGLTTGELASRLAAYGFKPIKGERR